jgi:hypothetical protein
VVLVAPGHALGIANNWRLREKVSETFCSRHVLGPVSAYSHVLMKIDGVPDEMRASECFRRACTGTRFDGMAA